MSQVTSLEGVAGLRAGNTVETLQPRSVLPSAQDLDATVAEQEIAQATAGVSTTQEDESAAVVEEFLDEENTFDVSRAEYSELRDAFLSLIERIRKHNIGAPFKI